VLNEAGAKVPPALLKFGTGVKRKQHVLYGNHFKDDKEMPASTHVKF
jgi:ATP-dependent RNA helicase DBP3